VGLIKPPSKVEYTARFNAGELRFDHATARAIFAALGQGAMAVRELAKQPGLSRVPAARLESAVHTLIAAGQVVPFAAPAPRSAKGTGRFTLPSPLNRHVAGSAGGAGARDRLVSKIAGRGVAFDLNELCFTHAVTNGHSGDAPEAVLARFERAGRRVKRGGEVLNGRDAALAELRQRFDNYKETTLPLMVQLGIVEGA